MAENLKLFNEHSEYAEFVQTEDLARPNVSYCIEENEVHYNPMIIESLASIANLGENPSNALWTPTDDELLYIQTAFDAQEEDSVDWSSATLYVIKRSDIYKIWSDGSNTNGWEIAVNFNYKIEYFDQPAE